jgi:hypothetical protein
MPGTPRTGQQLAVQPVPGARRMLTNRGGALAANASMEERRMPSSDYGKYFWCIGLNDVAASKVFAYADQVEISPNGSVILRGPNNLINLAFQPGQWVFVYVSSPEQRTPLAVDRWPGEIPVPEPAEPLSSD